MNKELVIFRVIKIFLALIGIENQQLKLNADIFKEYNVSSLQLINFIVKLEEEFDIEFEDDMLEIGAFRTLNEISTIILSYFETKK